MAVKNGFAFLIGFLATGMIIGLLAVGVIAKKVQKDVLFSSSSCCTRCQPHRFGEHGQSRDGHPDRERARLLRRRCLFDGLLADP